MPQMDSWWYVGLFIFKVMHLILFLRSLPVDSLAVGPHQTLNSSPRRGGGVGGPHLDRTATGWHQQRRELRSHQGLRPKQAGQRAVRTLSGQTLTGWGRVAERVQGVRRSAAWNITAWHVLNVTHAGAFWCSLIRGLSESTGHCWSRRGKQRGFLALLKGAESAAALFSSA